MEARGGGSELKDTPHTTDVNIYSYDSGVLPFPERVPVPWDSVPTSSWGTAVGWRGRGVVRTEVVSLLGNNDETPGILGPYIGRKQRSRKQTT